MTTLPAQDSASAPRGLRFGEASAAALVVAALGWSYAPSFANLVEQWNSDPNNTYGFLVVPIALLILWERRGRLDRAELAPSWWGFATLLALLALRVKLFESNEKYVEAATIPFAAASLVLFLGGWHLVRVCLPALAFLLFMLPLPPSVNMMLAGPLQKVATVGSLALLQTMGLPVFAEGNVIIVGSHPLEVARACNGLSMLLSFVTLTTATVLIIRRPLWERVLLLASAVPIALISNVVRITGTAWCYHRMGYEAGEKVAHDVAGWAMMPFALLLVFLELRLFSWLVVEVDAAPAPARPPRGEAA